MLLGTTAKLNVTQAVKLPYLVDVVANHILGHPITEGTHQAWENGVVTSEVWHFLRKRQDSDVFHLKQVPWAEEQRVVIDCKDSSSILSRDEKAIVRLVAREFGDIRAGELGRLTKRLNPHVERWGSNKKASIGEDAFDRLSDDYQEMARSVAKLTLDELRKTSKPVTSIEEALA